MTGIIGAMEIEVASLIANLQDKTEKTYSGIKFFSGKFEGADVVIAQCGIGKVNAAICAQTMVLMYSPTLIINTGAAGSLSDKLKIGDIVIAADTVQHDFDVTLIGIEKEVIPCTPSVVTRLTHAAHGSCHIGTIATGDQFISCAARKKAIADELGAIACEMEGASIARVCLLNNVQVGIVRAISDNANDDANFDFNEFLQEAVEKSVKTLKLFFRN